MRLDLMVCIYVDLRLHACYLLIVRYAFVVGPQLLLWGELRELHAAHQLLTHKQAPEKKLSMNKIEKNASY